MQKEIWDERGERLLRIEQAEPVCGEDFCDTCGDCLHCYGSEPCLYGGEHRWIVYEKE